MPKACPHGNGDLKYLKFKIKDKSKRYINAK
jgi:hypothetical protein